jgi:hypothetical protein
MEKFNEDQSTPHGTQFLGQIKILLNNFLIQENGSSPTPSGNCPPIQNNELINVAHTQATFMAFADTIIPSTLGALDLRLDEFIQWTLDHYVSIEGEWGVKNKTLSSQTARLLDMAASQLECSGKVKETPNYDNNPNGGLFSALSPQDRLEAIRLLENLQVDMGILPHPYRNNSGLVQNVITALHVMVMFGYYSEWFSFGLTRLAYPENQRVERHPFIWDSVDYPGPSFGYRAFRGFLVDKFSDEFSEREE